MSSRLSVGVCAARHGRGRSADRRHRRSRASVHPGRDLRQGARVRRACALAPPRAASVASRRRQGRGTLRADHVGRCRRRDRRALAPHHRQARGGSHPAVLLRGHDGADPVLRRPSTLPCPGRQPARSDDLHQHGLRGMAGDARHRHRQRLRADGGRRPHRAVGRQRRVLHRERHDAGQAGARARRLRRLRRPLSHTDRRAGGRAPDGTARHRHRARARHDARAHPRGPRRPRIHRAIHPRLPASRRARRAVPARARRHDRRPAGVDHRGLRPAA